MTVSEELKELLKSTHKFTRTIWTSKTGISYIGYGHILSDKEDFVKLTKKQCIELFEKDISTINRSLTKLVKKEIPQNHFDALASVLYDIGPTLFKKSSLLMLYNKGLLDEASLRIMVWSKYKGIHSSALEYRRRIDYKIFTSNIYTE